MLKYDTTGWKMSAILLSIKPEFVEKILTGEKKFEYRKTRCRADVDTIIIYATRPVMRVVATVRVLDVVSGRPDVVWKKTRKHSGITRDFFDAYYRDADVAFAYKLGDITKFTPYKNLDDFGISHAPQSFVYVK